jgi:hypothetical protein
MASRKDNPNRNETFGRLLSGAINSIATYEGRTTPVVEEELGQRIALSGKTIQRYKSGHLPREDRTIAILAEAAIQRGYLGRVWLQRFLHAARYPFADKLLEQLCPIGPARPRPPRVYHNLPAPTYSQFVMRAQAFAEIIEGLSKRSAAVLIVGLGGNGKTSLAREIAARSLKGAGNALPFEAVVWISDKDRPGTTNLSIVLDEIARTLDYPGFTQFAHDEKLYEVGQLLRRQCVLVIVDNFETITDGALLTWLLNLPEPSKTLITSREYSRAFRNNTYVVDLRGMSKAEAQEFVGQRLCFLKIEKLVNDQSQLEPLLVATCGNPKAIEIALGLVKHERRPLQQVVDDLYAARGELFDDLFTRAWALLDEATRHVLLVLTFFPASASGETLAATADAQAFAFDCAVERLTDLALLDVQQEDLGSPLRYALHPLVRAFAGAKLAEQSTFEEGARERWITWYTKLASEVSARPETFNRLAMLDAEQETAYSLIRWLFQRRRFADTLKIASDTSYYYYIRGLWDQNLSINFMGAEAAHILNEFVEEMKLLSYCMQRLSIQGNFFEAEKYLPRLQEIAKSSNISSESLYIFHNALASYRMANHDLSEAERIFRKNMNEMREIYPREYVISRMGLSLCLYQRHAYNEAELLLRSALQDAITYDFTRNIVSIRTSLARIQIDQGNIEGIAEELTELVAQAYQYQDRWNIADIQRLYARLHILRGDRPAARAALAEAIDLFERLGMRRELAEARAELARLDAPVTSDE